MLAIEHLSVDYNHRGQVVSALKDFSLTIAPGEAIGLVGPSGSGKSTVALAILRLIRPVEGRIAGGRIIFNDQDLLRLSEESMRQIRGREIAMIFQDPFTSLNPVLRIREQMQEIVRAHSLAINLVAALEEVQLEPLRTLASYPHQLSGGQRQRVMIAMALLCKPQLILADEPTTSLDVLVQKEILELLSRLQKERQAAVLLITHNPKVLARYVARTIALSPVV
jgi:ABC-type glutathione transport system ATPase component